MYDRKKIRRIAAAGAAILIAILGISLFAVIDDARRSATLDVVVAPENATVTVGGKKYGTEGVYKLEPGKYAVEIVAEGLEPYRGEVELLAGETTYLYHYLTGADGDMSYYDTADEEFRLMTIVNFEAKQKAEAYAAKDPILKVTPYFDEEKNHFRIYAKVGEGDKIEVAVDLNTCTDLLVEGYKEEVREYLAGEGVDVDDYEVEWRTLCG